MNKLVSIILPIYNVSKYIGNCLDSVLSQSYTNFEIIAVNDGTTDNSVEILESYSKIDNRIKIVHQVNQGLATARNTGLKHSSGTYIYFMDTDDVVEPRLIEDVLAFMQKTGCDIVTFEHVEFSGELDFGFKSQKSLKNKQLYKGHEVLEHFLTLKRNNWIAIWMYFFNREFLLQTGLQFKEGGINHEDVLFTPQILLKSNCIGYLNHTYYYYRQRPNSITTSANSFRKKDHFIIANELYVNACNENSITKSKLLFKYVVSRYEHIITQIKSQKNEAMLAELNEVKKVILTKKYLTPYLNQDFYNHFPKSKISRCFINFKNWALKWPRRIYNYQIKPFFK